MSAETLIIALAALAVVIGSCLALGRAGRKEGGGEK